MYKIVELNERDITHFKGKICQVLDSARREVSVDVINFCYPITSYMWVLTCLVEVEK